MWSDKEANFIADDCKGHYFFNCPIERKCRPNQLGELFNKSVMLLSIFILIPQFTGDVVIILINTTTIDTTIINTGITTYIKYRDRALWSFQHTGGTRS